MPTNEELLALLQKIHEIARTQFDRCKDNISRWEPDYWEGITEVTREILKLIEPLGVTAVPIVVEDRDLCPNCKTDLYLMRNHVHVVGRTLYCITCEKCGLAGPQCEYNENTDRAWNLMVKEMQHASETN